MRLVGGYTIQAIFSRSISSAMVPGPVAGHFAGREAGHHRSCVYRHASILKFIEWNWGLAPPSKRCRDDLPDPLPTAGNRYAPRNGPATDDRRSIFDFRHRRTDNLVVVADGG